MQERSELAQRFNDEVVAPLRLLAVLLTEYPRWSEISPQSIGELLFGLVMKADSILAECCSEEAVGE